MPDQADGDQVFALYRPGTELDPILEKLRAAGLPDGAVHVLSGIPWRAGKSGRWGKVPVYLITVLAGLVGIGVGLFFAAGTAALYPISTGGKPIVARPVAGIISYETMMLLAIVTTFAVLLTRVAAMRRAIPRYDTRIADGYMGVTVRCEPGTVDRRRISELLRHNDLVELRTAA